MLALLLDEQISPAGAEQIGVHHPRVPVESIYRWRAGTLAGASDALVLRAAAEVRLTLVTYDLKTIPPLLAEWSAAGVAHGGVVFVDQRTIRPADFGRLIRGLVRLWDLEHEREWVDRIVLLEAP